MSQPRRGEALLARVDAEVRLEGADGPVTPEDAVLERTRHGMLGLMNRSLARLAKGDGLEDHLPELRISYRSTTPGTYMIDMDLMDPRPPLTRAIAPVPAAKRDQMARWVRWGAEMVSVTVQILPLILVATKVRMSSEPDADGFSTMVIDDRLTVRVPRFISNLFDGTPEGAANQRALLATLYDPELRSLVLVKDPSDPARRMETVVDLPDGFHRILTSADFHSIDAMIEMDDVPLREMLTRSTRRQSFGTGIAGMGRPN